MIYLKAGDVHVVILETENIERIKQGKPAVTFDNQVWIGWTPDPLWLADRIRETNGDFVGIAKLIEESLKRPETPKPDDFQPFHHEFSK